MSGSSLAGHEPISMDVEIGEWVTSPLQPMVGVERGRNLLVRCGRPSGRVSGMRTGTHVCFSGFHPLRPNSLLATVATSHHYLP